MLVVGIILIVIAVAMIVAGRPASGVPMPFLEIWPIGQVYALGAIASAVAGTATVMTHAPF